MLMKETDLIYEGIATESVIVDIEMVEEKETDLIYEGIATLLCLAISAFNLLKETDLIYEGIATRRDVSHSRSDHQ